MASAFRANTQPTPRPVPWLRALRACSFLNPHCSPLIHRRAVGFRAPGWPVGLLGCGSTKGCTAADRPLGCVRYKVNRQDKTRPLGWAARGGKLQILAGGLIAAQSELVSLF